MSEGVKEEGSEGRERDSNNTRIHHLAVPVTRMRLS